MRKNFVDLKNNEAVKDYVDLSRDGNKTAQKHLYYALSSTIKNIQYRFYYAAKKVGLNLKDLEEECMHCFMQLLENYEEEKGTVENFFKSLYFNRVRTVIRRQSSSTRMTEVLAIGLNGDFSDNEADFNCQKYDENKKAIDDVELSKIVLGAESKIISEKEKDVIHLYIQSYNFKEMSKIAKIKYGQCLRKFKTGKQKIEIYLKNINIDLDEE